jgi:hypothetical protein
MYFVLDTFSVHGHDQPMTLALAPLKSYTVHVRWQHPAHDERNGFSYSFTARSKAQACRYARRQFRDDGQVGRAFFTATEVQSQDL